MLDRRPVRAQLPIVSGRNLDVGGGEDLGGLGQRDPVGGGGHRGQSPRAGGARRPESPMEPDDARRAGATSRGRRVRRARRSDDSDDEPEEPSPTSRARPEPADDADEPPSDEPVRRPTPSLRRRAARSRRARADPRSFFAQPGALEVDRGRRELLAHRPLAAARRAELRPRVVDPVEDVRAMVAGGAEVLVDGHRGWRVGDQPRSSRIPHLGQ